MHLASRIVTSLLLGLVATDAPRDSALVVLIDDAGLGEAPVVGTAWVPGELPSEAWGRIGSSGDTTVFVQPRERDVHLLALLRRSAEVRAFLPSSPAVAAQATTAAAQACTAPPRPLFEFQVDQPAAYRGDMTRVPRPAREQLTGLKEHPEVLVVQFVVDTLGVPVPRSFRVLQSPSAAAADSARRALPDWRFTPAIHGGCRVPQLVQTAVTR